MGELIKIDDGEIGRSKAVEVFLADGRQKQKRVELDLIRWDEIKEEEKEEGQRTKDDKNIQTEGTGETRYKFINPTKEFPNLLTGGGLLPDPSHEIKKKHSEKAGWNMRAAYPMQAVEKKEIPSGASSFLPLLEGDHAAGQYVLSSPVLSLSLIHI